MNVAEERFAKISRFRVQRPLVRGSVQDSHLRQGRGMSLPSEAVLRRLSRAFVRQRRNEDEMPNEAEKVTLGIEPSIEGRPRVASRL